MIIGSHRRIFIDNADIDKVNRKYAYKSYLSIY